MKLQLAFFAAAEAVWPKDGPKEGIIEGQEMPKSTGAPMVHCSQQPGTLEWNSNTTTVTDISSTSATGQFGSVSIDNYVNQLFCYIDFANECDGQGVDIEFTSMAIEPSSWAPPPSGSGLWIQQNGCLYDDLKFMYTDIDGFTAFTTPVCGIFNGASWSSASWYAGHAPAKTKYSLVGTDMKLVVSTDYSVAGGFADFNWQCRSYGNDICPSTYNGRSSYSGCYVQSDLWQPGKDVSCSMENSYCLSTRCSADRIDAFFHDGLFHVNKKHPGSFHEQLQQGIRKLRRADTGAILQENQPCGYKVLTDGVELYEWNYADCGVAPSMKNGKIAYGVTLQALGNDADNDPMVEFYVDFDASAECLYDPEVDIEASFFINQEDVDAETSQYGSLLNNFKCLFFEDAQAKNQIKDHNIVNMGERLYGRVRSKNNGGYGLIYKLQRVTFADASGTMTPAPKFHVIGGGSGGMGSTVVKAAVQKSKYVPNKPYWREVGRNMKFSFLSFGFEHLADQNEVDIKCRIKIDIDPVMFPEAALGGEGTRTLGGEAEYDYDEAGWGSDDYYDEDY